MDIISIIGPTASGKTAVAVHLADLLDGVVLSADSRQVYRGMDIGTGKDLSEYKVKGRAIPYYMIDICDAGERYNVYRYQHDFFKVYHSLPKEQAKVLCGGSGLYLTTVLGGYQLSDAPIDPQLRSDLEQTPLEELQERLRLLGGLDQLEDPQNRRRVIRAIEVATYEQAHSESRSTHYPALEGPIFCIDVPREVRRQRITTRLHARLQEGMVAEVERLLERVAPEDLKYYGLEYKYVTEYVLGETSREKMEKSLETAIHQFAKRQMTWIRGMERQGYKIEYIKPAETPRETAELIQTKISDLR